MKAILLGATGMVGQGVLRECLLNPEVESVRYWPAFLEVIDAKGKSCRIRSL